MVARRFFLVLSLSSLACRRDESDAASQQAAASSAATSEAEHASSKPKPKPSARKAGNAALVDGLDAALERGITPPANHDGTYHVDPFVAVLLFEHLSRSKGAPWFEPFEPDGKEGGPEAGYRVARLAPKSLPARLGLRDGDVVEALDGVVLTGPDRIGFALDGAENGVTVMIHRDDVSFTNSYRLSGGQAWRNVLAGFTGAADPRPTPAEVVEPEAPAGEAGVPQRTPGGSNRHPGGSHPSGAPARQHPASGGSSHRSPSGTSRPVATGVSCESASRCTVSKARFDEIVADPARLQSQAAVVPAIRNDVFSGYKLKSVKPGSSVAALGFRAGDKITHVNGHDLTNDVQAMQLYWQLGATRVFKIRYERGGRPAVKTVVVE